MGEIKKSRKLKLLEAVLRDEKRLKEDKERDGLDTKNNDEAIKKMQAKIEQQKKKEREKVK